MMCFPCCSICAEFEVIQERALRVPETSEELQEMMTFVQQARTVGMIRLNERIKVCVCVYGRLLKLTVKLCISHVV